MSKLRAPLKDLLDEPLPEVQVQRIWRKVQAPAATRPVLPLLAAGCALIAGLVIAFVVLRPAAPLAVNDVGALAPTQMLGGEYPTHWPLTDGSRIELGAAARLEVVRNTGEDFAVELKAGHAGFDVQPGGPRRWSIRAGELRVEVVGTSFVVERNARGVAVQVRHGVVLVRGPGVDSGSQRLLAGERVFVPAASAQPSAANRLAPNSPPTAASPSRDVSSTPTAAPLDPEAQVHAKEQGPRNGSAQADHEALANALEPRSGSAQPKHEALALTQERRSSAAQTDHEALADALEPRSASAQPDHEALASAPQPSTPGVAKRGQVGEPQTGPARTPAQGPEQNDSAFATLLREADQARQRHDFEGAYALLERVRGEAPGSVHAALASWTMGRMHISSDPARAASDIAQALQGKLPDGLREAAQARLVEAYTLAGDQRAARAAANAYRAAHPEGRYRSEIKRWMREP